MLNAKNKNKIIIGLVAIIAALGLFFGKTTIEQKDITIKTLETKLKESEIKKEQLAIKLKEVSEEKDIIIRERINADGSSVTTKKISSKKNSKDLNVDKNDTIIKQKEEDKKDTLLVDKSTKITNPPFLDISLGGSNRSRFNGDLLDPDWHLKIQAQKDRNRLQIKINDRNFSVEYDYIIWRF